MSGSYDRPGGPRTLQPAARAPGARRLSRRATGAGDADQRAHAPPPKLETGGAEPPTPLAARRSGPDHRADRSGRLGHGPLAHPRHHHHVLSRLPDRRRGLHDEPVGQRLAARHRQRGDGAGRSQGAQRRRQGRGRRHPLPVGAAGHRHRARARHRRHRPAARALARTNRCAEGAARSAPDRHRARPQHPARSGRDARRRSPSNSRASRSTITAAGSSRSAPSRAPSRWAASPSCCWSAPPPPPSSSRPPRAPWHPTARSSRCCTSSAPRTVSSPASSSATSCGLACVPASSARSGRCSCSWRCPR